ncbi:MAG: Rpn family recombination-promoting nuclease/putative transposase [Sarcina sp.]
MGKGLLDPKTDFIFKKIFGSESNKNILISFLNATLNSKDEIKEVTLENTDVEKNFIEDKFSRLDIKATTNKGEKINIEIQLRNEKNMIKRTLYYWSKMYEEQLTEGRNYSILNRTVCINILNFDYLENNKFHSMFRLKDVDTDKELSDIMEIHFIEIPKLTEESEEKDMLAAWVEFLKNPESEKVRNLENDIKIIREAKDELVKISADKKQRAMYEMRQKAIHDEANALYSAREQGREQGIEQGKEKGKEEAKFEVAKNLLDVLDDETISIKTGLSIVEVRKLRESEIK